MSTTVLNRAFTDALEVCRMVVEGSRGALVNIGKQALFCLFIVMKIFEVTLPKNIFQTAV